ncbi:MAG: Smr/MutS family protein [Fibrobacteres bacterium]|nr:Smr/MutS family protein [Fibrobacterota bacterium]
MSRKPGKRKDPLDGKGPARLLIEVDEELDLHGLSIAEAMAQVELALARWTPSGGSLRVIHGHSSGASDSIKGALRRKLESVWKSRIAAVRPEPGNPGSTLIRVRNP